MELERAYREAGPKIVGWLVATGTDEATARDLLHDATVRIARRLHTPRSGGDDLAALLFTAARNLRRNLIRDSARLVFTAETPDMAVAGARSPSDSRYVRRRIAAALAMLPATQRDTFALHAIGGRSIRETASLTGAAENLVKVRLHRAKKALCIQLADLVKEMK